MPHNRSAWKLGTARCRAVEAAWPTVSVGSAHTGEEASMHIRPLRRGTPALLWVATVLALCSITAASAAASSSSTRLAGTWSGKYSGAYSGTFILRWTQTGSKLRGSIALSRPRGTYPITGSVNGTAITFGTVGVGTTYTGSVSGKSMSGHYKTARGGGTWSARKTP